MNEPQMGFGEEYLPDPVKLDDDGKGPKDQDSSKEENNQDGTPNEDKGKSDGEKSKDDLPENDEIVEGWREDRKKLTTLKEENRGLKSKLAKYEAEDEDYSDLSDEERVQKIIEKREKEKEKRLKEEDEEIKEEIRFFKRTDKFFKANEKEILKVAVDFNTSTLAQAIGIYKKIQDRIEKASKIKKNDDKRQKNADGRSGGDNNGKTPKIIKYDPKVDSKKSISDIYHEAL